MFQCQNILEMGDFWQYSSFSFGNIYFCCVWRHVFIKQFRKLFFIMVIWHHNLCRSCYSCKFLNSLYDKHTYCLVFSNNFVKHRIFLFLFLVWNNSCLYPRIISSFLVYGLMPLTSFLSNILDFYNFDFWNCHWLTYTNILGKGREKDCELKKRDSLPERYWERKGWANRTSGKRINLRRL